MWEVDGEPRAPRPFCLVGAEALRQSLARLAVRGVEQLRVRGELLRQPLLRPLLYEAVEEDSAGGPAVLSGQVRAERADQYLRAEGAGHLEGEARRARVRLKLSVPGLE